MENTPKSTGPRHAAPETDDDLLAATNAPASEAEDIPVNVTSTGAHAAAEAEDEPQTGAADSKKDDVAKPSGEEAATGTESSAEAGTGQARSAAHAAPHAGEPDTAEAAAAQGDGAEETAAAQANSTADAAAAQTVGTAGATDAQAAGTSAARDAADAGEAQAAGTSETVEAAPAAPTAEDQLAERTEDLLRVTAEYANYRRRTERERGAIIETAKASVITQLLPILDDLELARQHGDLEEGPMKAMSDKLSSTLTGLGLKPFGQAGDEFDPEVHEAVQDLSSGEDKAIGTVLRQGYTVGGRVVRTAMVIIADPEPAPAAGAPAGGDSQSDKPKTEPGTQSGEGSEGK